MNCQHCDEEVRAGFYGHCIHCGHDLSKQPESPCWICAAIMLALLLACGVGMVIIGHAEARTDEQAGGGA